ncbi:hypothetical protein OC834_000705 [Tilletia horrida]|uniref:NADH-ubiquinone oxidoreductase 21.3 kDa subunit n=1 Tax=Tilletia horrida TaxID=155126 RepID=A0AAN6JRH3_9BASI|nr:hypothetical protein OC842_003158 [Tilletia horrida]KAK0537652.1 hypothetical protein OC834_000705 [Tilletia horrida]KAK0539938.1 hypothetical protein OC835_000897 [Tilletia horrida]KAK0566646.1 hypothetical protein OC844_000633 [Tilletia horrida]
MSFRASIRVLDRTKYASSHAYTYIEGRTPFWRKFREMVVVNPEISSGLPDPARNRYPQPASRPEHGATPPSKASDIANNLYDARDARRKYPRLEMITQKRLTELLLASPNPDGTKSILPPGEASSSTALTVPSDLSSPSAFTDVLAQAHSVPATTSSASSEPGFYTPSNLPPTPPFKRPALVKQKGAVPHDPHAYYPAENFA